MTSIADTFILTAQGLVAPPHDKYDYNTNNCDTFEKNLKKEL